MHAIGTDVITRVELKKDSRVVAEQQPQQREVTWQWQDPGFDPSHTSYYYVRVVQTDGEEAISSPIWVN